MTLKSACLLIFTCISFRALPSCQIDYTNRKSIKSDTASIVDQIFKCYILPQTFGKSKKPDTLYFIKSPSYYNKSWPKKIGNHTIVYLIKAPENEGRNEPSDKVIDKRMRFSFPDFSIKEDSAFVSTYMFGSNADFIFELKQKSNVWKISKTTHLEY